MKFSKSQKLKIAIGFLLAANLATGGYLIYLQNRNPQYENPYPLIDISRNFISQEHFIVNIQPLREQLQRIVQEEGVDVISIYFEFLNTGANIQINKEMRFYPASLMKIPTAMAVMKKIENREWKMDDRLVLFEQDQDSRYGTLYKKPVGATFSIEELLRALLIDSDNTAHQILIRNLSSAELAELQNNLGLEDLLDENYKLSVKEYSRLFRSLYTSSFLKRENSQRILEWLTETPFSQYLEAGFPRETVFSHKIGEDGKNKNFLDAGIVYLVNRPYAIAVGTTGYEREKAQEVMKKISEAIYKYISNYQ